MATTNYLNDPNGFAIDPFKYGSNGVSQPTNTTPLIINQIREGVGNDASNGGQYQAPSGQTFVEQMASAGKTYGNLLGGMLPGGLVANFASNAYMDSRMNDAAKNGGHAGTYTGDAAFGNRANNTTTEAQTQAGITGKSGGGPLSGGAWANSVRDSFVKDAETDNNDGNESQGGGFGGFGGEGNGTAGGYQ